VIQPRSSLLPTHFFHVAVVRQENLEESGTKMNAGSTNQCSVKPCGQIARRSTVIKQTNVDFVAEWCVDDFTAADNSHVFSSLVNVIGELVPS